MQKLIDGYLRFRTDVFPQWKDHFHLLAESQAPKILFITCADSRIVPSLIFQSEPGDMFLCRNAGNVVPPAPGGERTDGVSATIEYAVEVLRVEHIIICGHSDCGAVRAARQPELARGLTLVEPWMHLVQQAQEAGLEMLTPSASDPESEFRELVWANIVGQLANLKTQRAVSTALAAGRLEVHGWYYDIMRGSVEAWVPSERSFVALEQHSLQTSGSVE